MELGILFEKPPKPVRLLAFLPLSLQACSASNCVVFVPLKHFFKVYYTTVWL